MAGHELRGAICTGTGVILACIHGLPIPAVDPGIDVIPDLLVLLPLKPPLPEILPIVEVRAEDEAILHATIVLHFSHGTAPVLGLRVQQGSKVAVELIVGDRSRQIRVKLLDESIELVIREDDVQGLQGLAELIIRQLAALVVVELTEGLLYSGELVEEFLLQHLLRSLQVRWLGPLLGILTQELVRDCTGKRRKRRSQLPMEAMWAVCELCLPALLTPHVLHHGILELINGHLKAVIARLTSLHHHLPRLLVTNLG